MPSDHIFLHHDPNSPPPHPGQKYTRFVCISDTHSRLFPVPSGDVLLHAGDLSSWGQVSQLKKTIDWLKSLPHPTKIVIAGNHDLCLDQGWASMFNAMAAQELVRGRSAREAGIHYLEHESTEFTTAQGRRWKVYGSPATPLYVQGAFQYTLESEAKELYARIPGDTDILLTHTPPFESHDITKRGKHAGCRYLATRLRQLEEEVNASPDTSTAAVEQSAQNGDLKKMPWRCRLYVWGHIHEAYGGSVQSGPNGSSMKVNAAIASHGQPVIVDLYNG